MPSVAVTLEMYLSGSWVDVTADVRTTIPIHAKRGLGGSGPSDRVALPGVFEYALDNSEANSGAKLGYYSPDNSNLRAGFGLGTLVRLKFVSGGVTFYAWRGRIKTLDPLAGKYLSRVTNVACADYMDQFSIHKLHLIPVQVAQREDQIIPVIVSNIPIAPLNTSYAVAPDTFPYALHDVQDENTFAITALQKLAQTDLGYIFVTGNMTDGEMLVYESRQDRAKRTTVSAVLNDSMIGLTLQHDSLTIGNSFKVTVFPGKVDAAPTTVLASLQNEIPLNPSESQMITMRYRDPSGAATRISGINMTTPLVADTNYKASSISGDGGNDKNGDLGNSVVFGGNSADVTITNNGAGIIYVNKLTLTGQGLYLYDPLEYSTADTASQAKHGDYTVVFNLAYQTSPNVARDFANHLIGAYKDPHTRITGVTFIANSSAALMTAAMTCDIGSRVTITETVSGINRDFFINAVDYVVNPGNILIVTWLLEPASAGQVWLLDDPLFSILDSTTKLGF